MSRFDFALCSLARDPKLLRGSTGGLAQVRPGSGSLKALRSQRRRGYRFFCHAAGDFPGSRVTESRAALFQVIVFVRFFQSL
jgi:hypothetical protein